ncbi:MAG: transcription-repair coupling factor, partial [Pseudomonadota bacterium]|nr:transcription-repair coupling factor [Pseudomonadota bacterium]
MNQEVSTLTPEATSAGTTSWTLPSAGTRFALARPPGSGDAWLLSQFAAQARGAQRMVVAISADALDAQRLVDEIRYFDPSLAVRPLPDWETLPYDTLSPHQDLVSERLETLYRLSQPQSEIDVLVVSATSALYRLSPAQYVAGHTFFFKQGQTIHAEPLRAQLVFAGYQHVSQVVAPGEFAIRGGLIDLFPMGSALPYRLDLFGDQLDTIRAFDPDTQRGLYPVPEVRLLPGREFPIDEAARQAFRRRWRERIEGDPSRSSVYKDIGTGIASAGIEYYLPLFFDETATLFDYLPTASVLALHGPIEAAMTRFWNETNERYRFLSRDVTRPIMPPADLFLNAEGFFSRAKDYGRISLAEGTHEDFEALPLLAVERRAEDPIRRLHGFADAFVAEASDRERGRILIVADSAGRRETISQILTEYRLPFADNADFNGFMASDASIGLGVAPLHEGFV